jgi:two-component system response regulator AtoC
MHRPVSRVSDNLSDFDHSNRATHMNCSRPIDLAGSKNRSDRNSMKSSECRKLHIAVLDRDRTILNLISHLLSDRFHLSLLTTVEELAKLLGDGAVPDLLLLDWHVPSDCAGQDAYALVVQARVLRPLLPVIVFACSPGPIELALASSLGGVEFIPRQFKKVDLEQALQHSLGDNLATSVEGDGDVKEIPLNENTSFVRSTRQMKDIEAQCVRVARADIPILILGESGTGKEVAALLIHKSSTRSKRSFLKVNCAAMPADLLESELFGYEQGAFTGAVKSKPGKFELCDGGTIFLDEIGEMPAVLQAKLLQVLQDGTFSRLGGRSTIRVDVRIIAATNVDVKQAMAQKQFREDLYYRLNGFTVKMPPLRERTQEIPVLAAHFMNKASAKYGCPPLPLSPALVRALMLYPWPGNIRELENTIKRYLVIGEEKEIIEDLLPTPTPTASISTPEMANTGKNLKAMVRTLKGNAEAVAIAQCLSGTGWNRKAAADDLEISYKALLYKIKQYNLRPGPSQTSSGQQSTYSTYGVQ